MSYGFPETQNSRPRGGGGCIFFLIVIGIGAFLLMGQRGQPEPRQGNKIPGTNRPLDFEGDRGLTMDDLRSDDKAASEGWSLDDVDTAGRGSAAQTNTIPNNKSTEKNGWSMGEVDTDPKKPASSGFKFSTGQESKTEQKQTTKGDWSMGEQEGVDKLPK